MFPKDSRTKRQRIVGIFARIACPQRGPAAFVEGVGVGVRTVLLEVGVELDAGRWTCLSCVEGAGTAV